MLRHRAGWKRNWILLLVSAVAAVFSVLPARAANIFDLLAATESVVRILVVDSHDKHFSGSGFIVNDRRDIVTNYHVIQDAKSIKVGFLTVDGYVLVDAVGLWVNADKDLAVIEAVKELPGEPVVLATGDLDETTEVKAVGFPGAADIVSDPKFFDDQYFQASVTAGTVSRLVKSDPNYGNDKIIQHTAAVNHGNSGGPLFDNCRRVVGMNAFIPVESLQSQGIFFSIHASEVAKFLSDHVISFYSVDTPCSADVAQAVPASTGSDADHERTAFGRLVTCLESYPCDHAQCVRHYQSRTLEASRQSRQGDIDSLLLNSKKLCGERREQRAYDTLLDCAEKAPACDFVKQCEDRYTIDTPDEFGNPRRASLDKVREHQETVCKQGGQSASKVDNNPPVQSGGTPPPPANGPAITARTYWAELAFDRAGAQGHADEMLQGNCSDKRVRVTVDNGYQVNWEYREATRRSQWGGHVDPASGSILVNSQDVRVFRSPDNAALPTPAGSGATGLFSNAEVTFAPCGKGRLVVLN